MTVWDRLRGATGTDWLERQIASGRAAHAWLILGPPGAGKRSASLAIAAALNCPERPLVGCGRCSSCLRVLRRRHPDVHHVVPEGPLIPVDVIRDYVTPEAARSPFEGSHKIFIIEEADRMNDPAQNALLKTLEEPQADTVFVLISDKEDDLLETIRSRSRIARLEAIPERRIVEALIDEGAPESRAVVAARASDGHLARARAIALDDIAGERRNMWLGLPRRLVSPVDALDAAAEILAEARTAVGEREALQKEEVVELAEALGEGRGTAAAKTALAKRHRRELRRIEEETLGEALQTLASFYRDVLAVRSGGADAVTNLDQLDDLGAWASAPEITDIALVRAIERCIEARASLTRNANQTLAIEATLAEIAYLIPAAARVGADWSR
jgi:DNA polymerase III subunit delta'